MLLVISYMFQKSKAMESSDSMASGNAELEMFFSPEKAAVLPL